MAVLPNGFDVSRFKPDAQARSVIRAELGIPMGVMAVGLVARWDPVKNIPGFMEVARQLLGHDPQVHIVLAGKGLDMRNAELVSAMPPSLAARYHLLGLRTDIPAVMSSLDFFVLPSHGEGFPNALGEAMATGLVCAVTDVGDCAEILGSAGRAVPAGDMQGLAQATMALMSLSEPERAQLSSLARARIASRYALDAVVRQHEGFYSEVAGSPAIPGGH
jgi:glycosyltransferase involved in cell wall biosynthesis